MHATAASWSMPLQTLGLPVVGSEWVSDAHQDVVAAGVAVWRKRVVRLAELLRRGAVIAEVGWYAQRNRRKGGNSKSHWLPAMTNAPHNSIGIGCQHMNNVPIE
jgi:sugar phosphate isomerase/epimerase